MSESKRAIPEPTEIAGRYEIVQRLGAGAFGTVYKARDRILGRMVAIKTIRLEGLVAAGAGLDEMLDRFTREAQVAAQLKHPNIVTIYDIGDAGGLSYLAMEFIDGVGLEKIIAQTGRLPLERAASLAAQVADALDFAHRHNVVHRDIKPANIMIEAADRVKVTDFGIAKVTDSAEHLTVTGSLLGTPSYMSPEQARGTAVDGRSDLFSLGCVIYEMLAGRKAFRGDSITALIFKIIAEEPQPIREVDPNVPDEMVRIIAKALSKSPEARYQAGRELAQDLFALTRPGFVPTIRQAETPTASGASTPPVPPTLVGAPTLEATVGSAPTVVPSATAAGASGTVPPLPPSPTVASAPTLPGRPPSVLPPVPPTQILPSPPAARPAAPPQRGVAPARPVRRSGGGGFKLVALGAVGVALLALAGLGGWALLGRRATLTGPSPETGPTPSAETAETPTVPAGPSPTAATAAVSPEGAPVTPAGPASPAGPPQRVATVAPVPRTAPGTSATRPGSAAAADPTSVPPPQVEVAPPKVAAGDFSYLEVPPEEGPDGRLAGETVAQKYRSGGSTGLGAGTRFRRRDRIPRNLSSAERPAVATLAHLMFAQGAYNRKHGSFGTVAQLKAEGLLRLDVPVGPDGFERGDYRFGVTVEPDGFRATAQPLSPVGRPFVADDTGLIRPDVE